MNEGQIPSQAKQRQSYLIPSGSRECIPYHLIPKRPKIRPDSTVKVADRTPSTNAYDCQLIIRTAPNADRAQRPLLMYPAQRSIIFVRHFLHAAADLDLDLLVSGQEHLGVMDRLCPCRRGGLGRAYG